jgi:Na+-translocating ferredoxin:NAD+ oxidoreductase RnfD subunit
LLLAPDVVASLSIQWGNYLLPMITVWILGSFIIWQVKQFHICATYVVSFLFFAYVRSWITSHPFLAEVAPITGPMYQLFIFFMITDPKTTVQTTWGQCVVVFLVALVEMILRLNESVYAPLYALFLVEPIANLIEIWWSSRQPVTASAPQLT